MKILITLTLILGSAATTFYGNNTNTEISDRVVFDTATAENQTVARKIRDPRRPGKGRPKPRGMIETPTIGEQGQTVARKIRDPRRPGKGRRKPRGMIETPTIGEQGLT